jgi:tRNA threonylcarbamoyladenosine biosynthesis protein TsaE
LEGLGTALARFAQPGAVLLLAGELGSGKTTLTQAIARELGIPDPVTSPTFILMQRYDEGRIPLIHADLYRLSQADPDELELWDPDSVSVIEWPDRLLTLPEQWLQLELLILPDQSRRVRASGVGWFWQQVKNELDSFG